MAQTPFYMCHRYKSSHINFIKKCLKNQLEYFSNPDMGSYATKMNTMELNYNLHHHHQHHHHQYHPSQADHGEQGQPRTTKIYTT